MASSGSPLADKASKRLSASKNPSCPIVASANQNLTHQIRTGREKQLFFEVPKSLRPLIGGNVDRVLEGRVSFFSGFLGRVKQRQFAAFQLEHGVTPGLVASLRNLICLGQQLE